MWTIERQSTWTVVELFNSVIYKVTKMRSICFNLIVFLLQFERIRWSWQAKVNKDVCRSKLNATGMQLESKRQVARALHVPCYSFKRLLLNILVLLFSFLSLSSVWIQLFVALCYTNVLLILVRVRVRLDLKSGSETQDKQMQVKENQSPSLFWPNANLVSSFVRLSHQHLQVS